MGSLHPYWCRSASNGLGSIGSAPSPPHQWPLLLQLPNFPFRAIKTQGKNWPADNALLIQTSSLSTPHWQTNRPCRLRWRCFGLPHWLRANCWRCCSTPNLGVAKTTNAHICAKCQSLKMGFLVQIHPCDWETATVVLTTGGACLCNAVVPKTCCRLSFLAFCCCKFGLRHICSQSLRAQRHQHQQMYWTNYPSLWSVFARHPCALSASLADVLQPNHLYL